MLKEDKTKKREERHKITQEDFTPPCVVNDMLAKLPQEVFTNFNKTIIDYSCGIGNFLVEILNRRLENCTDNDSIYKAVKSIYGVELMADNVEECRERLYKAIITKFPNVAEDNLLNYRIRATIRNRIQWYDSLKFDYNHWPSLAGRPRAKHENVTFKVVPSREDIKYPMWYKEPPKQIIELTLFNEDDCI